MDDPVTWLKQAQFLDDIYTSQKKVAQTQLKNQVHFLVTDIGEAGFYPIRRLVDGIKERRMDAKKCKAQEIQYYRHHLIKCGLEEIRLGHAEYDTYHTAYLTTCKAFNTSPSSTEKVFWVNTNAPPTIAAKDLRKNHIINAMKAFNNGDRPDGYGTPLGWHVVHPDTKEPFPLKGVYGLATGFSCSHKAPNNFKTNDAIRNLKKLDFKCVDLRENTLDKKLQQGIERSGNDTSEARRERLRSAPHKPVKAMQTVVRFHRNPDVIAERLHMAKGKCEYCGNEAPFLRKSDSTPFLEVHHVISLADDGDDIVENTHALCPNCHRKAHHG